MEKRSDQAIRGDILVALHYSYAEEDWVTPLSEALDGVTVEEALWNPDTNDPDAHCLWEIVSHLTVWTENIMQRRAQRQRNETPGKPSEGAWPALPPVRDVVAWNNTRQRLWDSLEALRLFIETIPLTELFDRGNVGYSQFDDLLCRFTHNAYHIGQITKLRQWYKATQIKNP